MTTLEEKLARQREKWRRAKARRRRAESDAKYGGRTETLEILHREPFLEFLIDIDALAEDDVGIQARIDEATDELLCRAVDDYWSGNANWFYAFPPDVLVNRPHLGSLCTVRVRMTVWLVG
jgi:hypothetical protein